MAGVGTDLQHPVLTVTRQPHDLEHQLYVAIIPVLQDLTVIHGYVGQLLQLCVIQLLHTATHTTNTSCKKAGTPRFRV